jgi:hypothetical protein
MCKILQLIWVNILHFDPFRVAGAPLSCALADRAAPTAKAASAKPNSAQYSRFTIDFHFRRLGWFWWRGNLMGSYLTSKTA